MKKVLSLAFIAAVLLLGCSADGFLDGNTIHWSQMCKTQSGCREVQSKTDCDEIPGVLVMRNECR